MRKEIIAVIVIFVLSTIGVVSAVNSEMLTYTNEEKGFSIEYPEDWRVTDLIIGSVFFSASDEMDGYWPTISVSVNKLPREMSLEECVKADEEIDAELYQNYHKIEEYSTIINGKDAIVTVYTGTMLGIAQEGVEIKTKRVLITDNLTEYRISCGAGPASYEEANKKYFDPMIQSFKPIPKTIGIEIQNFLVTPTKKEKGKEVTIKFDTINKASVEKTKTFHCSYVIVREGGDESEPEEIGYKTVTLTPDETEHIEFTYTPYEVGTYEIMVGDQFGAAIRVGEKKLPVPGFEAVFAIAGLLAVAYLLRRRG
jgi:PGF-CTERM protein